MTDDKLIQLEAMARDCMRPRKCRDGCQPDGTCPGKHETLAYLHGADLLDLVQAARGRKRSRSRVAPDDTMPSLLYLLARLKADAILAGDTAQREWIDRLGEDIYGEIADKIARNKVAVLRQVAADCWSQEELRVMARSIEKTIGRRTRTRFVDGTITVTEEGCGQ